MKETRISRRSRVAFSRAPSRERPRTIARSFGSSIRSLRGLPSSLSAADPLETERSDGTAWNPLSRTLTDCLRKKQSEIIILARGASDRTRCDRVRSFENNESESDAGVALFRHYGLGAYLGATRETGPREAVLSFLAFLSSVTDVECRGIRITSTRETFHTDPPS